MSQILIYTKDAKLPKSAIKALTDAGIIPVQVERFDQVKLMEAVSVGSLDLLARCAFKTIHSDKQFGDDVKKHFGKIVASELDKIASKHNPEAT